MMKLFRSGIALLLAVVMALSLAACTGNNDTTAPTETQGTEPSKTTESTEATQGSIATVESPVSQLYMELSESTDDIRYLYASDNGDGGAHVEYSADEKRMGTLSADVLTAITTALAGTELADLDGQEVFDGEGPTATMSVTFADGTTLSASFSGNVPQEFRDGYAAVEAYFLSLASELELPQAQVLGEVNADALAAMQEILNNSGMEGLDSLNISDVVMDDYFGFAVGLTSSEGITSGTSCAPMIMSIPYSLVIVTLESEDMVQTVRADFEATLAERQWVCGMPESALMAHKGNMVLFLVGSETMFQQTATAIENTGWTEIETMVLGR